MPSLDLIARFIGVDAGMGREFDRMSGKATATEGALARFGKVGPAALAVLSVESIKMAAKFQSSMELIHTQAGVSQKQVDSWSKSLLGLSGQVATSPEALSEALFHIASTGARGARALNELKIAAEGAKVGGADLTDVTNALNATIVSGIKGAGNFSHAMGALNAIVGAGDMHMQDLADALGSGVLAVVKTFGVNLTQAGAALAVFGDNNIRGAQAATYLRQAVQSISDPGQKASKALGQIGLTVGGLQDALAKGGLTDALTTLHDHFETSGIAANRWGDILEQAFTKKAGVGITVLLEQFGRYQLKQAEVAQGAKDFGDDWSATTKTLSFQSQRLGADIESLAVKFGTTLIPVALDTERAIEGVGSAAAATFNFFKDHEAVTMALAGALSGALAPAAIRAAIALGGTVWTTIAANLAAAKIAVFGIADGENEAAAGARAWEASMGPVGIALAAVGAVAGVMWAKDAESNRKAKQSVDDYVQSLHTNTNSLASLGQGVDALTAKQSAFNQAISIAPGYIQAAARSSGGYKELTSQIQQYQQQQKTVSFNEGKIAAEYGITRSQVEQLAQANSVDLTGSLLSVDQGFQKVINSATLSKSPLKDADANFQQMSMSTTDASQALTNLGNSFDLLVGNFVGMKQAQIDFKNSLISTVDALKKSHGQIGLNSQASRDAGTAYYSLVNQIKSVTSATYNNGKSLDSAKAAAQRMLGALQSLHATGPAVQRVINGLKRDIEGMAGAALSAGESVGQHLGQGVVAGLQAMIPHVSTASQTLINASLHAMREAGIVRSPSQKTRYIGQMMGEGLAVGLKSKIPTVDLTVRQVFKSMLRGFTDGWHGLDASMKDALPSKYQDALSNFTTHLGNEVSKQESHLKKMESNYRSLAQARKQAISSLRGTISGGSDLSNIFTQDRAGNPLTLNASGYLSSQVGPLQTFAHDLTWARQHHLNQNLLSQIANLGPVQGDVVLKQFMTGVSSVGQANQAEALIQRYAGIAAKVTVDSPGEKARLAAAKQQVQLARHQLEQQKQTNRHLERLVSHVIAHGTSFTRHGSSVKVKITGKDLIKAIKEEERTSGKQYLFGPRF